MSDETVTLARQQSTDLFFLVRRTLFRFDYLPIIELAMYVSHVLDRKLLERLMSPSPKSQVMFASAFS